MHPLHDYVAKQLADKIRSRRVVVWYDARSEFAAFVAEVRGGARRDTEPVPVHIGGTAARLVEYAGSMLEVRSTVEPLPPSLVRPPCSGDGSPMRWLQLNVGPGSWSCTPHVPGVAGIFSS